MNNVLALDTSSQVLSVALKIGKRDIVESKIVGFLRHAENLLPMIDEILRQEKVTIHDLDAFVIGRGPGSFTGLRIGFSTLKGFLALEKKPCFGALSLDMIAENVRLSENSFLAACLDARREKIYVRFYRQKKGRWKPLGKTKVLTINALMACLPPASFVAGDALRRYQKEFSCIRGAELLEEGTWYPRASTLIRWLDEKDARITRLTKPRDFLPLYFRFSEAEEKRIVHGHRRRIHI